MNGLRSTEPNCNAHLNAQEEQKMKRRLAAGRALNAAGTAGFFASLGLMMAAGGRASDGAALAGFAGIIASIIIIITGLRHKAKAEGFFAANMLMPEIRRIFPGGRFYRSDMDMGPEALAEVRDGCLKRLLHMGMAKDDYHKNISNILAFDNGGHQMVMFSLECWHKSYGSRQITVYSGTQFLYKAGTHVDGAVRVIPCGRILNKKAAFTPRECECTPVRMAAGDEEFDGSFEAFASDRRVGFYAVNPHVIGKIKTLRQKYGELAMCAAGDQICLSFNCKDRFLKMPEKPEHFGRRAVMDAAAGIMDIAQALDEIGAAMSGHAENGGRGR